MSVDLQNDWTLVSFLDFERSLNGESKAPIHVLRKKAFENFSEGGFPTPQVEEWKYTNLAPLRERGFVVAPRPKGSLLAPSIPDLECVVVHLYDGYFLDEGLSSVKDVTVQSLKDALKGSEATRIEELLGRFIEDRPSEHTEDPFYTLNTAFVNEGIVVKVKKGAICDVPLLVSHVASEQSSDTIRHTRILVLVEAGASVKIVETFEGPSTRYCTNAVIQFEVAENAHVDHYRIQREGTTAYHLSHITAQLSRSAEFRTHTFTFGGGLVRNQVNVLLEGEGCNTTMNGLTAITGDQHVDNQTLLDNQKPHCESLELYKGIYGDRAEGVFSGTIIVRPEAQKTNAIQSNRNLLLTNEASVNTKPQLKIWADDVKCTHGATVGQLDDTALFYIQSRGVSEKDARVMLIHAFASEIIGQVRIEPLRTFLEGQLLEKLGMEG